MSSSPRSSVFEYWKSQAESIRSYWIIYGGFAALIKSPFFVLAALLTALSLYFRNPNVKAADITISAIPNLLGFTLGALAIVLAFSSAKIFKLLAEDGEPHSFFMKLTSALVHFILVQVLALICGILAKITDWSFIDGLGLFLLYYGILVTFSTAIQLFLTAQIYNTHASLSDEVDDSESK